MNAKKNNDRKTSTWSTPAALHTINNTLNLTLEITHWLLLKLVSHCAIVELVCDKMQIRAKRKTNSVCVNSKVELWNWSQQSNKTMRRVCVSVCVPVSDDWVKWNRKGLWASKRSVCFLFYRNAHGLTRWLQTNSHFLFIKCDFWQRFHHNERIRFEIFSFN